MRITGKYEVIIYLIIGAYITTPGNLNIFYRLINYFSKDASRGILELCVFLKLGVSIIGVIIVLSAVMELFNKVRDNEFA